MENKINILLLKTLRHLYCKILKTHNTIGLPREENPDKASEKIFNLLSSDKPCMITRFGSTEMTVLVNYVSIKYGKHDIIKYIQGKQFQWWWEPKILNQLKDWSGFFPINEENINRFSELMLNDMEYIDILGSWLDYEYLFYDKFPNASLVTLPCLEPFLSRTPWTLALKNKKILVVHPFKESIISQYNKRELLFKDKNVLPGFKELHVIQSIQSLGGNTKFENWFVALEWMKEEIDKVDYDICLLGCGAYGFPLAAHIKRKGKKAVHLGGALQLLFGIKGKRWDDSRSMFYNEYWVRPNDAEKPKNAQNVENSCYW